MRGVVWNVENAIGQAVLKGLFWLGWGMVLFSAFLVSHFDLFGLRQVWLYWSQKEYKPVGFQTPLLYKVVRCFRLISYWKRTPISGSSCIG